VARRFVHVWRWLVFVAAALLCAASSYGCRRERQDVRKVPESAPVPSSPAPRPARPSLPSYVEDGFHRDDRAPAPALTPESPPVVGQYVKVQVNLQAPMECANYPGETTTWLAMGGRVSEVVSPALVRVELTATTDRYPKAMDGHWRGTLVLQAGKEYPWTLTELSPEK
jgi:hypothetical protein